MHKLFTPSACDPSFNFHRDYKRLSKRTPKPSCLSISEMTIFKGLVPRFQAFSSISDGQPLMQCTEEERDLKNLYLIWKDQLPGLIHLPAFTSVRVISLSPPSQRLTLSANILITIIFSTTNQSCVLPTLL